jgi:hypothetical protein
LPRQFGWRGDANTATSLSSSVLKPAIEPPSPMKVTADVLSDADAIPYRSGVPSFSVDGRTLIDELRFKDRISIGQTVRLVAQ